MKCWCRILCFLIATGSLSAQSFFASRGLGTAVFVRDGVSSGSGGLYCLSVANPALPVVSTGSEFTLAAMALGNYATDGRNQRLTGAGRPELFRARVPLPLGFRFGLGFGEWYNQDFDIYSDSLPSYRRHIVGRGGVYDLNASLAGTVFNRISLGVEYNRLLGGSNEIWRFDAYEGNYITFDTIAGSYAGNALRFGLAGEFAPVQAVLFAEQILGLDARTRVHTHGSVAESSKVSISFPPRIGAGISYSVNPELKILAEGLIQDGTKIRIDGTGRSFFRNALRIAGGIQYLWNERYPLRWGGRYQSWYLTGAGDKPITELALTAGSSLPVKGFGSLDFALEYARQGTDELRENILRLSVSLFYAEQWKKRTRRWGY